MAIPDVALLDQHGRTRRLQAQVLGGGVNLVNFIFTTCSSLCPMASAVLAELSRQPEFAATQALRLVSITVDPLNDTPQRLHEFSKRFATPASEWRWDWLTGTPANVDAVLSALRQRGRGVEGHSTDFLLLDGRNGQGRWLAGDTPVRQLLAAAQRMVNAS